MSTVFCGECRHAPHNQPCINCARHCRLTRTFMIKEVVSQAEFEKRYGFHPDVEKPPAPWSRTNGGRLIENP